MNITNVEANFTEQDHKFMRLAIELADKAESQGEIPVGAVLVCDNKVIAQGWNQSIQLHDPSAHAEMIAIRQAGNTVENYRMLDCTLYVTLEPCPMCAGLLVHSRIKKLIYAAADLKTGSAGSVFNLTANDKLNHQLEVQSGLLADECSTKLSAFFKRRRAEKKALKQKVQANKQQ
ncbi:tRNA adenosine(34) deaminase TadA [Thalassomonas sp. M1454]|uniref:tRNA adenosine(34) deaminase TadA n=1 Tax=Thalassomonas sp. M1454 TaxID=2594477 RepID=UPI00117C1FE5|nr:tRNA adenosine(34) deaminase TadA [Thalassomonas sp. M1454]TRX55843.1 tRNA adenosine(34) deaminase TadA [Thalassomonas sp. M1454]